MRFYAIILSITTGLTSVFAQHQGAEITLEDGSEFLLGSIQRVNLETEPYAHWFNAQYESYQPRPGAIKDLAPTVVGLQVLIFLGTWCGDSKREVPRFMKIMDQLGIPDSDIQFIAVDKRPDVYKTSPGGEHQQWNIRRVPTFILIREGREIGRIVERPQVNLEWDLCDLLHCSPKLPHR